ncbi:hypothetical protein D1_00008 [Ralstonia phage Dimitile]|nr:hypothetical protein D1_00008 [Ralstonia phage Dimitile]
MSYTNQGGPAFPAAATSHNSSTGEVIVHQSDGGMTLRDYFAAQWLNAPGIAVGDIAKQAYTVADAMIRAREAA